MNKRISKAARANNEFKTEWMIAQHWLRMNDPQMRTFGNELKSELTQKWLDNQRRWA